MILLSLLFRFLSSALLMVSIMSWRIVMASTKKPATQSYRRNHRSGSRASPWMITEQLHHSYHGRPLELYFAPCSGTATMAPPRPTYILSAKLLWRSTWQGAHELKKYVSLCWQLLAWCVPPGWGRVNLHALVLVLVGAQLIVAVLHVLSTQMNKFKPLQYRYRTATVPT